MLYTDAVVGKTKPIIDTCINHDDFVLVLLGLNISLWSFCIQTNLLDCCTIQYII